MRLLLDAAYAIVGLLAAPVWLFRSLQGRFRIDPAGRLGLAVPDPGERSDAPRLLIHAVSVGEVNAIRRLVGLLETGPAPPRLIIAATTDTGLGRARALFGDRHLVIRYPLDLSGAVGRVLDRVRPDAVALVELEVWPNLMAACARRDIPVAVINGRLSERSFRRYRFFGWLLGRMFGRLSAVAARTDADAERFRGVGVAADRVTVAGNLKWDAVDLDTAPRPAEALREAMGIDASRPLVVAGSTAPEEHGLLQEAVPAGVQLLCAPRRPEWFDDAARALPGCARRSKGSRGSDTNRFLLDTFGELSDAYTLADVVVIGRTFTERHGSDMMEPVGLGKPTIVGGSVTDFLETVDVLLEAGGLVQTTAAELPAVLVSLLDDADRRASLAARGREAIAGRQGASARCAALLRELMDRTVPETARQKATRRPGG